MNNTAYFGIAVASLVRGQLATTEVDNLRISNTISAHNTGCLASGLVAADIGDTGTPGSTTVSGGTHTLNGAGREINWEADAFHYAYSRLVGDGQITARIDSVSETAAWVKAGIMVRGELTASAPNAMLLMHPKPTAKAAFQSRVGAAQSTSAENLDYFQAPLWLRLVRKGNVVSAYVSQDGQCWLPKKEKTISGLEDSAFFGLAVASTVHGVKATGKFSHVQITQEIEPFNAQCERAKIDIDLPVPTSWIVAPGYAGGSATWSYSTWNPNGDVVNDRCPTPETEQYGEGAKLGAYRTGPDDPDCPRNVMPAGNWTRSDYQFDTGSWGNTSLGAGNVSNLPGGIAGTEPTWRRTVRSSIQPGDASSIWFRKTFTLSTESQRQELMFWGRWAEGITIYINGVRASHYVEEGYAPDSYRYIGLSNSARSALRTGENVIGVRVEAGSSGEIFFDLGLTMNGKLANLPMVHNSPSSNMPAWARLDLVLKEALQEQGISAATLASRIKSRKVSVSYGYLDKNLTKDIVPNSVFRLASVDKPVTKVLIRQILNDPNYNSQSRFGGALTPDRNYFDILKRTGFQMLESELGEQVTDVTIQHLMDHESGIAGVVGGSHIDGQYHFSYLGISRAEWGPEDMARAVLMHDNVFAPGTDEAYSNDGYFLLRYLAERIIAPMTIDDYFRNKILASSTNKDIVVAYEEHSRRRSNEPGYMTRILPADRHIGFEHYRALASSADAFLYLADNFNFNTGERISDGTFSAAGGVTAGSRAAWKQGKGGFWDFSYFMALNVSYDHLKYFEERYYDVTFDLHHNCVMSTNLVNNCNFATGLSSWTLASSDSASGELINNRRSALVEISNHGNNPGDLRLSQKIGKTVAAGLYRLKFKARVAGPVEIQESVLDDSALLGQFERDARRYIRLRAVNEATSTNVLSPTSERLNVYMPTDGNYHEVTFRVPNEIPANTLRIDFELGKHSSNTVSQPKALHLDAVTLERIGD